MTLKELYQGLAEERKKADDDRLFQAMDVVWLRMSKEDRESLHMGVDKDGLPTHKPAHVAFAV